MKNVFYCLLLVLAFTACKKNRLGGKSSIKGKVAHHGKAISNATVYIKFDAQDFPGSDVSVYDKSFKADIGGYYEIPEIYKGEYYLYAVGEDPSIPPPYEVVGGVPTKVRSKEVVTLDIPVTEGD
ncbi:MAG: hypothetical protein K0S33_1087 [Bacteroidetes bacterium]|jgi:hypothetical protein|nr:hypothetical protein [Bacteroidota bacterium]